MERSVEYNCHGPFYERPDLWWPVYVEGVCYLDNDIFYGKTKLEVVAEPLVSPEPEHEPLPITSWGSVLHPTKHYTTPSFTVPTWGWAGSHTTTTLEPTPPDVPPIPLPAGGLLMITALAVLAIIKGLRG